MATKTCPSCGTDVPTVAKRCRECFHDFVTPPAKPNTDVLLVLLGFLATAAVVGALTLFVITTFRLNQKIQVNQESQYIITTTQYVSGISTERVPFADIVSIEHTIVGNGTFLIQAIKRDGSYMTIEKTEKPKRGIAERYAKIMNKPFNEVDHSTSALGFSNEKPGDAGNQEP